MPSWAVITVRHFIGKVYFICWVVTLNGLGMPPAATVVKEKSAEEKRGKSA
jgi:hypothetical protein